MTSGSEGRLRCFLTLPQECGYLQGQESVSLVVDPALRMDRRLYSRLVSRGFRRSGNHVYRPHCAACSACVPLRVDAAAFAPNRSQRRVWRRNADLETSISEPVCDPAHFELYSRYLSARHAGGGMDDPTPEGYRDFLFADGLETLFLEQRLAGRLLGVAVLDVLDDGLSAVYSFFDPAQARRSLGVYAILQGIAECRRRELPWLYLGYWIEACPRMNYKARFRPHQLYREGHWEWA